MITSIITSLFIQRGHRNQSGNKLGSYKYLGAAIGIHDIISGMLVLGLGLGNEGQVLGLGLGFGLVLGLEISRDLGNAPL